MNLPPPPSGGRLRRYTVPAVVVNMQRKDTSCPLSQGELTLLEDRAGGMVAVQYYLYCTEDGDTIYMQKCFRIVNQYSEL